MPDSTQRPYVIGICVALALGFLAALAGSANGLELAGLPIFAWAVILAFLIQWLAFVPAWLSHTEHFFDMVGSLTYLAVVALALVGAGSTGAYPLLLASMVAIWATRLGWFLSARIRKVGFDSRFDVMKHQFIWFLMTWTLQGLWVVLTAGAALAALTAGSRQEVGLAGFAGFLLWTVGLGIEVAADEQKRQLHLHWAVGAVSPSQLLGGNHSLDGHCHRRSAVAVGLELRNIDLTPFCLRSPYPGEWHSNAGSCFGPALGRRPRLRGIQGQHPATEVQVSITRQARVDELTSIQSSNSSQR